MRRSSWPRAKSAKLWKVSSAPVLRHVDRQEPAKTGGFKEQQSRTCTPKTFKSVGLQTRTSSKLALACLEQTRTNTKVNLNKGLGLDFLSILFDHPSFPEPIAFLPGRPPFQNQSNHFPWDFRSFCRKNGEGTPRAKSLGAPPPFLDLDLGFLLHLFFLRTSDIWTSFLDLKWFLGVGISKLSEPLGFPKTKGSDAKD